MDVYGRCHFTVVSRFQKLVKAGARCTSPSGRRSAAAPASLQSWHMIIMKLNANQGKSIADMCDHELIS